MKKLLLVLFAFVAVFALTACKEEEVQEEKE